MVNKLFIYKDYDIIEELEKIREDLLAAQWGLDFHKIDTVYQKIKELKFNIEAAVKVTIQNGN